MFFESRAWKHLRAALVLGHVVAIFLAAVPAPVGGSDRANWKNATAQAEFALWAGALRMQPADFEDKLFALATFWMNVRAVYLTPVDPWIRFTGTDQPWRMFVGPDRYPARFQVQYRPGDVHDFITLFEEKSAQYTWHKAYFSEERVRSQIYRHSFPDYAHVATLSCKYLAARVFEEKPDAAQVRCRFFRQRSRSPQAVLANTPPEPGQWEREDVISR